MSEQPLLEVTAGVAEIELGKAFPLTVVRAWERDRSPPEWNEEALAPLVVRPVETTRREGSGLIEETRRYRAYAFGPGEISEPVELRVKGTLDPDRPGPAELPGEPLREPSTWLPWSAAGAALVVAAVLVSRRRGRPGTVPVPEPEPPPPGPHLRALEHIERLRERRPRTHEQTQAFYVEAAGLIRDYVGERFEVRTTVRTSEDLLGLSLHPALTAVLKPCDLVKFARHQPDEAERQALLDVMERFVEETA
jgi:hypothetical protein